MLQAEIMSRLLAREAVKILVVGAELKAVELKAMEAVGVKAVGVRSSIRMRGVEVHCIVEVWFKPWAKMVSVITITMISVLPTRRVHYSTSVVVAVAEGGEEEVGGEAAALGQHSKS
jgi:hypothetical protein